MAVSLRAPLLRTRGPFATQVAPPSECENFRVPVPWPCVVELRLVNSSAQAAQLAVTVDQPYPAGGGVEDPRPYIALSVSTPNVRVRVQRELFFNYIDDPGGGYTHFQVTIREVVE